VSIHNIPVFERGGMSMEGVQRRAFNLLNEMIYKGVMKVESVDTCFCGDRNFSLLSRYDRFGLPFGTQICKSCGLITQTLRIHPDSLPEFYENIYWPLIVGGQPSYSTAPKYDETSPYILKHVSVEWENIRIFEVGCGSGARIIKLTDELKRSGHTVTAVGCDYSSHALEITAKNGIQTIQGGMDELLAIGQADILILSHVFEHFPDLEQATKQIEKLVRDDSLVYIEVPGVVDLENKREYFFSYQDYCVLAHTYNFSLATLTQVMSRRGFTLVEGDEYVRAVFRKGVAQGSANSSYGQIMASLQRAHKKQRILENRRNRPIVKYLRNVAKALLGRGAAQNEML